MDAGAFERLCLRSRFTVHTPIVTRNGRILLAERYFSSHPEFPEPHWQTLWAVERNGMDVAQKLFFKWGVTTSQERLDLARKTAELFIGDNISVGRYQV